MHSAGGSYSFVACKLDNSGTVASNGGLGQGVHPCRVSRPYVCRDAASTRGGKACPSNSQHRRQALRHTPQTAEEVHNCFVQRRWGHRFAVAQARPREGNHGSRQGLGTDTRTVRTEQPTAAVPGLLFANARRTDSPAWPRRLTVNFPPAADTSVKRWEETAVTLPSSPRSATPSKRGARLIIAAPPAPWLFLDEGITIVAEPFQGATSMSAHVRWLTKSGRTHVHGKQGTMQRKPKGFGPVSLCAGTFS